MPLTVKNLKGNTKITWTNQDQTTEASWTIKGEATEQEAWEILTKATVFIGKQLGAMPEGVTTTPSTNRPALATSATTSDTPATPSSTSGLILGSGSFSDLPSDGGPPTGSMDAKFWESMPTNSVPPRLASGEAGWEMDVAEGWQ